MTRLTVYLIFGILILLGPMVALLTDLRERHQVNQLRHPLRHYYLPPDQPPWEDVS